MSSQPTAPSTRSAASVTPILTLLVCATTSWAAPTKPTANEADIHLLPHPAAEPALRISIHPGEPLDQNAAPLFAEAAGLVTDEVSLDVIRENGLSEEGEMTLADHRPALEKLRQAARCTQCTWDNPPTLDALGGYSNLARLVVLQIRSHVAAKRYPQAAEMLSSGYALSHALTAERMELSYRLKAVGIAAVMNEQALWMLQQPNVPALDFSEMPSLLAGVRAGCSRESRAAKAKASDPLTAAHNVSILKPYHDRAQVLATRVERQFDGLRAIQALQESAARSKGQLPATLPSPPATTQPVTTRPSAANPPITYKRTSPATAVITVNLAKDDDWKQLTYRITLAPR